MKTEKNSKLRRLTCFILLTSSFILASAPGALGQASTQIMPRAYPVLSNVLLTNGQALPAAGAVLTNVTTGLVAAQTNTFLPFSGSHAIGLVCTIVNTNVFAAASNLVLYVYPAYDTLGGNSNSINGRYGTNFSTSPLLTWTIPYLTNTIVSTNLAGAQWEPATALGYCITNATKSNIVVTLTQYIAP